MDRYDIIVIGQGYAGQKAAGFAGENGMRTANIEADCMGGLIVNLNELDPGPPGEPHAGFEIATELDAQNASLGVVSLVDSVSSITQGEDGLWIVTGDAETCAAPNVIIASGARLRKLNVPGEAQFYGQGVSTCADCDGPMFKNMETVVVGGGDAAFQEALELSQYASRVSLVLRGPASRARADLVERAAANPKLVQLFNTEVLEIIGEPGQGVNAIRIRTADGGETLHPCEGVFVFIGVEPNVGSAPEGVAKDTDGALVVSEHGETALKGIWAIGAARSGYGGMLTDAAEDARRAVATIISRRSPT